MTMPANPTVIEQLGLALEKARDRFREYETSHREKATKERWERDEFARIDKAERNREMADMLDAAITNALPELLALAKLGQLVREASPETIERDDDAEAYLAIVLINAMHKDTPGFTEIVGLCDLSDDQARRAREGVRALLRTLKGMIK